MAFRHRSVAQQIKSGASNSNERLEFLGDAVLGSVVAHFLFTKFPFRDEGFLTKMRSRIVSRQNINKLAIKLGIETFVQKGADNQNYFKRIELETSISDVESVVNMMPYFGFKNKISWEKKRINFHSNNDIKFCISLDETPMGYFLEIESTEAEIEKIIKMLELDDSQRTSKPYLGLWDEYKKANHIDEADMMFK